MRKNIECNIVDHVMHSLKDRVIPECLDLLLSMVQKNPALRPSPKKAL